ncbi:3-isopropylmalate dehydrogenase [Leekyejoonella antrihumi]|nr:3-isopropylmalate dehydrogenase [Leekyejoonella antrihumi]
MQISVIPGDGIGPEVIAEALKVLRALDQRFALGASVTQVDLGAEAYLRDGAILPAAAIDTLAHSDAILLGALGDPRVTPGILERGIIVALRTRFRQPVNVRPCKTRPGIPSPLRDVGPTGCDFVIVRENTEGLYVGTGTSAHTGQQTAVAVHTSITTMTATETAVRYAFTLARQRRRHLTLCHKTNILLDAGQLWMQAIERISTQFPDVDVDYAHVDAMCLHLLQRPQRYDVIVTDNLFGDILSDLGAGIQGGLGTAASANLNLDGSAPSMFEPVHGSAPDIAGTGTANPAAAILSVAMMLENLGHADAAAACDAAVNNALQQVNTSGTAAFTRELGDAVVAEIG